MAKGGHIRKGEKSEIVVFWKIQPVEEIKEDGTKEVKQIPLLRYYNVFHISQVDGVEPLPKDELHDIEPIEKADTVLHDYWTKEGITVEHTASNRAYYHQHLIQYSYRYLSNLQAQMNITAQLFMSRYTVQ